MLVSGTVAFANNDPQGTVKVLSCPAPSVRPRKVAIVVRNPSAETGLTVKVRNGETLDQARQAEVASLSVPLNTAEGKVFVVEGFLLGDGDGSLAISNDQVVGGAGTFTVHVKVRRL